MRLYIGGQNVSKLVNSAVAAGTRSGCSRTLTVNIAQSYSDSRIPSFDFATGQSVSFSANGFEFFGVVGSVSVSTGSKTATLKCYDFGLYLKRNVINRKIYDKTPKAAAKLLCSSFGIPTGYFAPTADFRFSRNFVNSTLYNAVMTGYALAAQKNKSKYQLVFDGDRLSIIKRGCLIAGMYEAKAKKNITLASYSESIENAINRIDLYDNNGNIQDRIFGDTSYGIMAKSVTMTEEHGIAYAQKLIRDNKKARSAKLTILGKPDCVTGYSILVAEPNTGLTGRFYIDADTHTWKNGTYITQLTLNYDNIMDDFGVEEAMAESNKEANLQLSGGRHFTYYGPNKQILVE